MNVGTAFETDTQTVDVIRPGMCAFNDPAAFAKATPVFGTALGDHRLDTAVTQHLFMRKREILRT